jgi:hypothetical protein
VGKVYPKKVEIEGRELGTPGKQDQGARAKGELALETDVSCKPLTLIRRTFLKNL